MNIFFLHRLAPVAAGMHCDKHVGKMLIESCQLLATAHHHFGHSVTYKPTHVNHPSNVWTRQSRLHYNYVATLALYLGREFFKRYGKHHKSYQMLLDELYDAPVELYDAPATWTDPPLAMPDEYKCNDSVEAYRRFYASKRERMPMVYFRGEQPAPLWLTDIWNEHEEKTSETA